MILFCNLILWPRLRLWSYEKTCSLRPIKLVLDVILYAARLCLGLADLVLVFMTHGHRLHQTVGLHHSAQPQQKQNMGAGYASSRVDAYQTSTIWPRPCNGSSIAAAALSQAGRAWAKYTCHIPAGRPQCRPPAGRTRLTSDVRQTVVWSEGARGA